MPGTRSGPHRSARRLLLLATGAATLAFAQTALAQETSALRGPVSESQMRNELFSAPKGKKGSSQKAAAQQNEGIPAPAYEPVSAGATPSADKPSNGSSIFAETGNADAFADAPAPGAAASRPPSTARDRAEQARAEAAQPPQTATERAAAEQDEGLDETSTGTTRAGTVDGEADLTVDAGAERAEAIEGIDRTDEENPFAPVGMRLGTFLLKPSLETGFTWTSNANYSTARSPALLSETTLRLNAASDWSRHSATVDVFGTFRKSVSGEAIDEKKAGIDARLRLDLADDYAALATLGYALGPESASSPIVITGTVGRPLRQTLTGSAGIEKDLGKLRFALTARAERDVYGDAELSAGGMLSQRDRNTTLATVALRGGYEISPALTPFVEFEVGRRVYDEKVDSSGYERSTKRIAARAGLEVDLGEKLSGEIAAGWLEERFDDGRLKPISGATLDASLAWSPLRGTIVNLTGSTTVEGATAAGESGSILYSGGVAVQRELRANLTGNLAFGAAYRDYVGVDGHDLTLSAEVGLTWWLNRYAGITGRARHETQTSSIAGRGYKVDSVFLGLKLQR
ncbi:MAG: outer membrane beta-barrel protein [Rhizobiaceae bacterium]|nr:MAG: outer membrane beta-barrel protein [Rhizobiaceae bacterium]CAG0965580.1 hypothetical protein RHIZO_00939 [Rhizobiaceae bacterium]